MAEDDDEDGFGDFRFATYKHQNSSNSNQMNGRNSSVADDDDEWGDFVDHSPQIGKGLQYANDFSFHQSSRNPPETSHLSDPFGFHSSGVKPGKEKWVKPQGALPLSIFGEDDVKEESSKSDSNTDLGENSMAVKINGPGGKGIKSNVDVGIDDVVSTLFSKNQKTETGNALFWNSNENSLNVDSNLNRVNPESPLSTCYNGWSSNMNDLNGANLSTELTSKSDLSFLEFNTNGVGFNNNNLSPNLVEADEKFYEADDDDDGWEFKAADMKANNGNENSKEQWVFKSSDLKLDEKLQIHQEMQDEPQISYFHPLGKELFNINGTQTPSTMISHKSDEWNFGLNFNPGSAEKKTSNADAHPQNKLNEMDKGPNSYPANGNVESDDNFGDFSHTFLDQTQKDEPQFPYLHPLGEELFNINRTQTPSAIISHKSGEWDFGLNFNPGSVEKETTMSDAHPQNKSNNTEKGSISYQADRNANSDDYFGEFSESFMDQMQKDEPKVPHFHSLDEELFNINGTQTPTVIRHISGESDFGLNINVDVVVKETTDASPQNKLNDIDKGLNSYPPYGNVDSDDNFGEFSQALPDQTQKINEELFVNNQEDLSNFSDRKLQNHNILNSQTTGSSTTIHDLISTLYHESEQKKSSVIVNALNGDHMNSSILEIGVDTDNDDFDEESWEFKDASPSFDVQDRISVISLGSLPAVSHSKAELNDFVNLFCKSKNYLSSLAFGLLENFEKAQSNTALVSKDIKAEAIDEDIQKFMDDLMQAKEMSGDIQSKSLSTSLDELLDLLRQPKFQVLESEYHLSSKLLMVETELASVIELLRHATWALRILESEPVQKQSIYVSSWSKMLSVCAQELRHGDLIWNESLKNNAHSLLLSEPQGRNNILALGEIYRVVKIIEASVKLYKPWILLGYVDSTSFSSLLTECSTLWSSSGLSEALLSISISNDFDSKTLVDSINHIQDLDENALQNHLLSGEKFKCHLSALTMETVPGMNMVDWNGVQYFLKLANLWANLISPDPPFSDTQMQSYLTENQA